jgi:predicted small lipoprotein YifL
MLVLSAILGKVRTAMKRIFALMVLLGIISGAVLAGCEQKPANNAPASTNAPAAPAAPRTNK